MEAPTEFRLSRGELSSISLSSSSKSVSNISVASDSGRGASAFLVKNASLGSSFWSISTRESIGVICDDAGLSTSVKDSEMEFLVSKTYHFVQGRLGIFSGEMARLLAFAVAGQLSR